MFSQMSRLVSYSPAYTIVPTYECFNRCSYCNFRKEPGDSPWLTMAEMKQELAGLCEQGVVEILILSGEVHPNSPRREAWCDRIYELCDEALNWGFLPHTNAGPLKFEEMARLKQVNVSMGLMLEQMTRELLQTVHRHAPSKVPSIRLQQLDWAGELKIPFTTGLLLGIGESPSDWGWTLEAIAKSHDRSGHIQEVIVQPYREGSRQAQPGYGFNLSQLPEVVAIARRILPEEITVQIPPNLVMEPEILLKCLEAGARDLGGIGPQDVVNPDYPHINPETLSQIINRKGWQLQRRLPIYPQYDSWLSPRLQRSVNSWRKKLQFPQRL
ncbi:7,8-didemethyl-8-hydroxy-5-deazariboflavin synthase subunit CofG [Limnospira fusiformis]|uniref:7,8-didemethyl-8-hydroxy-5-deazariboflavin synthase subunit CofG n=1 Tax=Limnospira fusiformis TaxID=54297 RepID=UPI001449A107|nr:7,8-didemethyl-8-hydroxy-5-deazariboflavin synthase subunit CofG [Limnospira fusiformis SAG 85.79]